MNSIQATHNQIAVSVVKETAINTEQTLDTSMLFAMGDVINLEPRREDNSNETIGKEEADYIYDNGALVNYTANAEKAMPQHFAFFLGFGLGAITTSAKGDGYEHLITPLDGDLDDDRSNPSFTIAQRYGKTIAKRRFASMFVDSVTATFARDAWVKLSASCKGTGKYTDDVVSETVEALDTATSLTLAANAVAGGAGAGNAAARLDNVQNIVVELATGVWTEVSYTAVSDAEPAVITIVAPGAAEATVKYKILYRPDEAAWGTFPARVVESPLRVSELTVNIGGAWSGSAFVGGKTLTSEISSLEYTLANNGECQFVPGAGGDYAGRYIRQGRTQMIKLSREFKNFIMQQHITDNDTFGVYAKAEGALYDETYKYQVEMIFPMCAVMTSPVGLDGKRLSESVDIKVLEHTTYGSAIIKVQNLVAAYVDAA
ncbi:hypothetical protein M0R72_14040 [Candidatus Pacearchaeota archaeon]|jgi:hypothetical protein|nr:hypothetical protein [Candidatus Pacearchaeota archaeon]